MKQAFAHAFDRLSCGTIPAYTRGCHGPDTPRSLFRRRSNLPTTPVAVLGRRCLALFAPNLDELYGFVDSI